MYGVTHLLEMKTNLRIRRALAAFAVFCFAFTASAQVYINEILADNKTAYNVDGEFPDYVELINTNETTAVNIANFRLSIDPTKPNDHNSSYIFPANSIVPAGGFLLVICDGNTNQRYHTKFSIGKKGENLWFLGAQQGRRDSVAFGFQVTDYSMGRTNPAPNTPYALCYPTPGAENIAVPASEMGVRNNIRFNEWMPSRDTQDDWFEIYNPEPFPVDIGRIVFSDRTNTLTQCTNRPIVTNSWMEAGGFLQFFADDHAEQGWDQVDFKMTSVGEPLIIFAPNKSTIIHQVTWTNAVLNVSYGWLPDGNTNDPIVTFPVNRDTPGDSNFLPIDNVLINEILAHTDPPLEDAIELYNPTATAVDISGWWLSDDKQTYDKFRIPNGTIIQPHGYVVFYEYLGEPGGFNPNGQGIFPSFSLSSSQGDDVYLYSTYPGQTKLNGFRRGVDFPASQNGLSYGRYITSTGESDFVPMSLTFGTTVRAGDATNRLDEFRSGTGATNGGPVFGPLVITEIMYHPPDFIIDTNIIQNELDEYVEIYNASTLTQYLWDRTVYTYPPFGYAYTNTYHLRGQIDFNFPTNVSLAPGESLLVVNFGLTNTIQLNTFRAKYRVPANVKIFGAYGGKLSDGGGTFQIERPDAPQLPGRPDAGFVPYLRVDKVRYDDDLPFPPEADGVRIDPFNPNSLGYCLVRTFPEQYGSDVINWEIAPPSPGYQIISNSVAVAGSTVTINFKGLAGSGYTAQFKNGLEEGTWQKLQDFAPQSSTGPRQVVATVTPGAKRFYRVVTPIQP